MAASQARSGSSLRSGIVVRAEGDDDAGGRALARDRLVDRLRDPLGTAAEEAQRAFVGALRDGADGRVEVGVGVAGLGGLARVGQRGAGGVAERGRDQARLDEDHVDAEAGDLEPQRVAQRLQRVLGRVVPAAAREGQAAAHRADVDDLAPALRAHRRQRQLRQPREAEDVRLELPADGVERDRLDGAALAVAGVVDQHADRARRALDLGDRRRHRRLVGDVERQQPAARVRRGRRSTRRGGRSPTPASRRRPAAARSRGRSPTSSP